MNSFPKNKHIKLKPHARRRLADKVFEREGWLCVYCGSPYNLTLMHKEHAGMGGGKGPGDVLENCETGCMSCHDAQERHQKGMVKK